MGSLFKVDVTVISDMKKFVQATIESGRRIYAAELRDGAVPVSSVDLRLSDIFMIGNEGHGIPIDLSKLCTGSVYIPITSKTESLNASVAAAIFMWEQNKLV